MGRSYENGRKYAEGTDVPAARSQGNILALVKRHGADGFMIGEDSGWAVITFRLQGYALRFRFRIADEKETEVKRLWRTMEMAIKTKLVIAQDGVESFEEVFLANIVSDANGTTVGEAVIPQLLQGRKVKLLPPGKFE